MALRVDRASVPVDGAAEVVYGMAVRRAQWEAVAVDPRQTRGVRAGAGGEDVAAEVVSLGLLRGERPRHDSASADSEQQPPGAREEPAAGGRLDDGFAKHSPAESRQPAGSRADRAS